MQCLICARANRSTAPIPLSLSLLRSVTAMPFYTNKFQDFIQPHTVSLMDFHIRDPKTKANGALVCVLILLLLLSFFHSLFSPLNGFGQQKLLHENSPKLACGLQIPPTTHAKMALIDLMVALQQSTLCFWNYLKNSFV